MDSEEPNEIAAARAIARRERERAADLAARVDVLETELSALRASIAWRLTTPLRRIAAAVPPGLYAALRGRPRSSPPSEPPTIAGDRLALLVDDMFPSPDRDSGSIDIVNMADALTALGFQVVFAARRDDDPLRRDALAKNRIHPIGAGAPEGLETFLDRHKTTLSVVVLNRVYCGGALLETVRQRAPRARIIFNTVDLHWIRIGREAELANDETLRKAAADIKVREIHLAREADATIVVSTAERDVLRAEAPGATIVTLPLARPTVPPIAPFAARNGVGFIGGFRHAPNRDAIVWFAREVWPLVLRALPECRLSIAGPDLPAGLLDFVPGHVEILGHVPDIGPWFESLRLTIAPLRFGAGAKGKLVSSLAAGVPCVATNVALEGMGLTDADGAIQADTPEAMARAIVALHQDHTSWGQLSTAACRTVEQEFSLEDWHRRLAALLATLEVAVTQP